MLSSYRPDIDGLRAVAVLSVVLFHFDEAWLPGGFVGVDVFFVISGFLISGNIFRQLADGTFTIGDFYRRRVRRIVPALTTVILTTLIAGHFLLLPEDLTELSFAALASQLFVGNVYFTYFLDTSYFADGAELQPLLHLWSLGVEEQFYLLWPLVMLLLVRRLTSLIMLLTVGLLAMSSFVLAQTLVYDQPMFAYYMLPARAGQLLAGAFCFFAARRHLPGVAARYAAAVLGILLLGWSLFELDANSAFPGWNALPVTTGAALLIHAGSGLGSRATLFHRLMSWQPIVFIGLLSYSIYLWHWPLLAFARYAHGELDLAYRAVLGLILFVLSWASWALVEQRFREARGGLARVAVTQFVVPGAVVVSICVAFVWSDGFGAYGLTKYPERLANAIQPEPAHRDPRVCQKPEIKPSDLEDSTCIVNGSSEPPILVWGDSNAGHYVPVLAELAEHLGFSFRNAVHSACPPIIERPERFASSRYRDRCKQSGESIRPALDRFAGLIISAAWDTYYSGSKEFEDALIHTLEILGDKPILLVGRVPRIAGYDRQCAAKALKLPFLECEFRGGSNKGRVARINERLRRIAEDRPHVHYQDFNSALCIGVRCSPYVGNVDVYFDGGHLSRAGGAELGKSLGQRERDLGALEAFLNAARSKPAHYDTLASPTR